MKIHPSFLAICFSASVLVFSDFSWSAQSTTKEVGASQSLDPVDGISSIYSDVEMRMRLATKPDAQACSGDVCMSNQQFDARIQLIGEHLAKSAYAVYPELKKKVSIFTFSVADKEVLGSASNASGTVVIFRGIQHLDLGDEALAFIVGREMGHVIASHHKSNAKTRLLISALAAVLFPAVGILSASSAATQATTATTSLLTSAASTATSIVGSEVAMSKIKPGQLTEADDVAISILKHSGLTAEEVAQSLEFMVEKENSTGWEKDLNQSVRYVRQIAGEPKEIVVKLEPLPEEYVEEGVNVDAITLAEHEEPHPLANLKPKEQIAPLQHPVEEKIFESHKVILITNESIEQSRNQRRLSEDKIAARAVAKKRSEKKDKAQKAVSSRTTKADANKTKSSKKLIPVKSHSKTKQTKRKVIQSKK